MMECLGIGSIHTPLNHYIDTAHHFLLLCMYYDDECKEFWSRGAHEGGVRWRRRFPMQEKALSFYYGLVCTRVL